MKRTITIFLASIFLLSSAALAHQRQRILLRQVQNPPEQQEQLTAEQKEEIQKLRQEWNKSKIQIDADLKVARIELQEFLKDESATERQIRLQLEKIAALDVRFKLGDIMLQKSLNELITPEQQKQLQQQKTRDARRPRETLLDRVRLLNRGTGLQGLFRYRGRTSGRIRIFDNTRRIRDRASVDDFRGRNREQTMPSDQRRDTRESLQNRVGNFNIRNSIENFRGIDRRGFNIDIPDALMPGIQMRQSRINVRGGMLAPMRRGGIGREPAGDIRLPQPPPVPFIPAESEEIYLMEDVLIYEFFEAPPPPAPVK